MSWQRILETSRKQGMPVIVTDIAGREPMVVMPLEAFETLSESRSPAPRSPEQKIVIEDLSGLASAKFQKKVDLSPELSVTASASKGAELTLEERFYLEPVDEDAK